MNHKKITLTGPIDYAITERISRDVFKDRIEHASQSGSVEDAVHCFENAINWYRNNISFSNPYNFNQLHAELHFL